MGQVIACVGFSVRNSSQTDSMAGGPSESSGKAFEQLLTAVYGELRKIAHFHRLNERQNLTLQTTALVHEAYLKLAESDAIARPRDERHLKALTSRIIRHVLIDYARRNNSQKRDAGAVVDDPLAPDGTAPELDVGILDLDAAMQRLAGHSKRLEQVVEYRYFGGMSNVEVAETLGVSTKTVERDWLRAKVYLLDDLDQSASPA
ncbi:ECF-type sigma factor [Marinihelvus fidelis]|uniref:ECF-type sigma factor n=1 Tax=Marinihelvus fidelis TaxID=2613842 RepID=UPI0017870502|nr:ECF-type sigma factor [Marinihelvus fidelis]